MKSDCPILRDQGRENKQAQASCSNDDSPKKNYFYALQSRFDQELPQDVVTGMLKVFSTNDYKLLAPMQLCLL